MKKIRRFPRLSEELGREGLLRQKIELGYIPKRWRTLKEVHRKAARMYARGESVKDICEKLDINKNALYRWINLHPKFRTYLRACAEAEVRDAGNRLSGRMPRAVKIIEESMESEDPYFAYGAAKDFLRGMGAYKTNVATQSQGTMDVKIDQSVEHTIPPEMAKQFVEMLLNVSTGQPLQEPKVIDIDSREVKALPPSPEENASKEVQKVRPEKAGGGNKQGRKRQRSPQADSEISLSRG